MPVEAWLDATVAGVFGLLIGSFLNVVIYRVPRILEGQWEREIADYAASRTAEVASGSAVAEPEPFNLLVPRSRCQTCGHQLRWFENIPVFSYLGLRGKCASCGARISMRYPLVELLTGALFVYCAQRFGLTATGAAWAFFCAMLVAMAFIDWDTTLLPDNLTLPLLWAGLLASAAGLIEVPLVQSVVGAAAGYLSLWLVYWAFKLATGKEGMGYGDFKLFGALGAWFGWPALVPLILMASVVGACVGIAMKVASSLREGGYVPFGPFLVGAGLAALILGPNAVQDAILGLFGL
ncbi:prepilin peptidase [Simplicispira suum]|uniref:Prepilin leader peptidase/N-methyltransferase n=1 Tax=Simplicispira suum TaxID=2109915 RepID=A0A2S0MXE6_9BURK|nr:A24 family peptidase [Simplicispira suum]AVO40554.1 prepilin peptidase [Simplicispira suum]